MTLREKLACRLHNAVHHALFPDEETPKVLILGPEHYKLWGAIADECIRQMEWNWRAGYTAAECDQAGPIYQDGYFRRTLRHETHLEGGTTEGEGVLQRYVGGHEVLDEEKYPLVLAPDDWSVPKEVQS